MIDSQREVLHRSLDCRPGVRLVGMHLARKAQLARYSQVSDEATEPVRLALPRNVREPRQAAPPDLRHQFPECPVGLGRDPVAARGRRQPEEESRNHVHRIPCQRRKHPQYFGLGSLVGTAPGLHFHGGGPVPRHGLEIAARTPLQALTVGGANLPSRRLGVESRRSRRWKRQVGVAVDESGHDYAGGGGWARPPPGPAAAARRPAAPGGGNARWVWLSTNPGMTTRPAALISRALRASARFSTRRVRPASTSAPSRISSDPS